SSDDKHSDANSDLNSDKRFVGEDTKTVDNSFTCAICSKQYSLELNLKRHMKSHDGKGKQRNDKEKRLECEICLKRFRTNFEVKSHMRTHTGETFKCELCPK
uniref:Transcription factor Ovo-like 1 n=1 Tax=Diabrotica virgifera virgifera TaxID=50390 RepID=A0A6P7H9J0_DIAVI